MSRANRPTPSSPAAAAASVWTFRDAKGRNHPVVPIAEAELGGARYTLGLSTRGVIALEPRDGALAPVTDTAIVGRLSEALASVSRDATGPAVIFEAPAPDGTRVRYAGLHMAAHGGHAWLVALAPGGERHVFHTSLGPDGAPVRETDAQVVRAVLAADPIGSGGLPSGAVLTLPSGEKRELSIAAQVQVGGAAYALAVDRADPEAAYLLKVAPDGALAPVTDPAELERVRQELERLR